MILLIGYQLVFWKDAKICRAIQKIPASEQLKSVNIDDVDQTE